jgi:hypothetical protein
MPASFSLLFALLDRAFHNVPFRKPTALCCAASPFQAASPQRVKTGYATASPRRARADHFDKAAWHTTPTLKIPNNLTTVPLPPACQELNAAENIWQYLEKVGLAPRRRLLFLRLGRKRERIAFAAARLRRARGFGLGNVFGVDSDNADPAPMGGHHHPIGLALAHAEFRLQHRDDELPRRVIVIDEDDLVEARSFGLRLELCFAAW